MTLSELKKNATGHIARLELNGAIRRRLQDIGFVPGAAVTCLRRSPLGDPSAYSVCGAIVAIRKAEAEHVILHE